MQLCFYRWMKGRVFCFFEIRKKKKDTGLKIFKPKRIDSDSYPILNTGLNSLYKADFVGISS